MELTRRQVLAWRVRAQQLDAPKRELTDPAILDLGVQDTGPDGAGWALANRGVPNEALGCLVEELVLAWTLRGAPHFYRRAEVAGVAAAVAPRSDADAEKRIFDAAKPLREAGIGGLEALDTIARQMRDIVRRSTTKGDLSTALTSRLAPAYLRWCRVCEATHSYEQTFRLSELRAGLELEPGSSPPVLSRIRGWRGPASAVPAHLDPVRGYLRLFGAATPQQVAKYVDTTVAVVKDAWPQDAVEVAVDGQRCWALPDDVERLRSARADPQLLRLLGPFDLFLQAQDRELVVPSAARRKELWVVLGRPGGVLLGHELVGTWRPRASGGKLRLQVEAWSDMPSDALDEQCERLAAYRGLEYAGTVAR